MAAIPVDFGGECGLELQGLRKMSADFDALGLSYDLSGYSGR
jgi:hypothetical protein